MQACNPPSPMPVATNSKRRRRQGRRITARELAAEKEIGLVEGVVKVGSTSIGHAVIRSF